MERDTVVVHIAVLAIADDLANPDQTALKVVVDKATEAGHRIIARDVVRNAVAAIREQLVKWIARPDIDLVIVTEGTKSEATSTALRPLVTQPMPELADLLRRLAYQSAASASTPEAARCDSTFVFVLPAAVPFVTAALEKLVLPQLDPRTPRNLIGQLPRLAPGPAKPPGRPVVATVTIRPRSEAVPTAISNEKTEAGHGMPPKLPAKPVNRLPRAETPPPHDDIPTKEIDVLRLEQQRALSGDLAAFDAVTKPMDLAGLLPRVPPGADDTLDDDSAPAVPVLLPDPPRKEPVSMRAAAVTPSAASAPAAPAAASPPATGKTPLPSITRRTPTQRPATAPSTPTGARATTPVSGATSAASSTSTSTAPTSTSAAKSPASPASTSPASTSPALTSARTTTPVSGATATTSPSPSPASPSLASPSPASTSARTSTPVSGATATTSPSPSTASTPAVAASTSTSPSDASTSAATATEPGAAAPASTTDTTAGATDAGSAASTSELASSDIIAMEGDAPAPAARPRAARTTPPPPPPKRSDATPPPRAARPTPPPPPPLRVTAIPSLEADAAEPDLVPAAPVRASGELPAGAFVYPTRRRDPKKVALVVTMLAGAAVAGFLIVVKLFGGNSTATASSTAQLDPPAHHAANPAPTEPTPPPPPTETPPPAPAPEPTPAPAPPAPEPPPAPPPVPAPVAEPPAPTPSTHDKPAKHHAVARVHATPPAPTTPAETPLPTPPASVIAPPPPAAAPGCDEVTCVLEKYERPCCVRFKPADSGFHPKVGGLPDELDRAMVRSGIEKMKPRVIACGEHASNKGTVKLAVTVAGNGSVQSISVVDAPDSTLGDCVASAIRKATFAKSVNGASFTYPFVF